MGVLIVTYELMEPSGNREDIIKAIKECGSWARLGADAYLMSTTDTPEQLRDKLTVALRPGDKLYVGTARAPAAWRGMSEAVTNWIQANQK